MAVDAGMQEWLTDDFMPRVNWSGPLEILSIGSGTGDFDLQLMTLLLQRWPIRAYLAIDPNVDHNQVFQTRFWESGLPIPDFQILSQTFPGPPLSRKFDLIHLTHCLYYVPDRRQAILSAVKLLQDHGCLLIFHQTPLGINEIQRRFLKRAKGDVKEMFSSRDIYGLLKELPISFKFDIVDGVLDVSDCLDPESPQGQQLINFFLECRADTLPSGFRQEVIAFIKELAFEDQGRPVIFHPVGVFSIYKPDSERDGCD
ncbi:MAG: methyltransferase domain-containing protein [Deltaproteobacteria bacterium]|nr:methyltransferase domain-containing protein [Deltaproteobacteria bacterium]